MKVAGQVLLFASVVTLSAVFFRSLAGEGGFRDLLFSWTTAVGFLAMAVLWTLFSVVRARYRQARQKG